MQNELVQMLQLIWIAFQNQLLCNAFIAEHLASTQNGPKSNGEQKVEKAKFYISFKKAVDFIYIVVFTFF